MKTRKTLIAIAIALPQFALAADTAPTTITSGAEWDGLQASYAAMLDHAPAILNMPNVVRAANRVPNVACASLVEVGNSNPKTWDSLQASFDVMLNPPHPTGPIPTRYNGHYLAVVEPVVNECLIHHQAATGEWDSLQASFDAMLNHTPHGGATSTSVNRDNDYYVERVVQALLRYQSELVKLAAVTK